jgi:meso-butanediol dehydrogenase/(S,S)-butanediol dehydrogenase/diacetyl reductase
MRLTGKVAFVSGASSGIGRAVAMRFAEEGALIVAVSRTREKLEEVVGQIKALGGTAIALPADVTRGGHVQRTIEAATDAYGGLHIMFNGAGGSGRPFGDGPVTECTEEGWDITLNMNLTSVFLCCKYGIPALQASGGGSIINLSSVLGLVADRQFDAHAYAAAKAGIVGLSRAIAVHYAPQGIRCNTLCPGLINTAMSRRAREDPAVLASMQHKQPLTGSMGTPAEVADAALFLASDESRFITGIALPVDAGWSAQ